METYWTVCVMTGKETMWQLVKAKAFNVNPDGAVTFWDEAETVAYFPAVVSITKGRPEDEA